MYDEKKPSEKYNLPVIGKILLKSASSIFSNFSFFEKQFDDSPDEYDVIQIKEYGDSRTYVVDAWNSPGVVQLIPDIVVLKFEEK